MNPELLRNLWLELTPHRLLAAPAALAALFGLVWLLADADRVAALGVAGYWITVGVGILWGARSASESVVGEVQDGTWDQQRLTSIEPWSMTWGKLLGAPVFTWYVCAPCLVLVAAGATARGSLGDALAHVALLVLILILSHATGLLASLHLSERAARLGRGVSMGLHTVGMLAAIPLLLVAMPAYFERWQGSVHWFAHAFALRDFVLLSTACFTAWIVVGCYRLMRAELQLRNAPWVWVGFVAFTMAWAAGVAFGEGQSSRTVITIQGMRLTGAAVLAAHAVALGLGYLMLLVEPKDPVALRRLLDAFARREWKRVAEAIPRWLCVLPLAAATALATVLSDSIAMTACVSALAFFVRDAGLVTLLALGRRRERADTAALFYLVVLYLLAPALLAAAFGVSPAGWLVPATQGGVIAGSLPAVLQALAVWYMVALRWRTLQALWR